MRKIVYLNLIIAIILLINPVQAQYQYCGNSGNSVCASNGTPATPGFENPDSIPCAVQGGAYNQSIQFLMFSMIQVLGTQHVDSIEFDAVHGGIGNLPCGLCWATNKANNRFVKNEYGCINISGTTNNDTGQYQLQLNLIAWINGDSTGIPVPWTEVGESGIALWFRVQSPSGSCMPVDTSSSAHNLTATATCTTGINELNNDFLSLSIVPNPVNANTVIKFISTQDASYTLRITDVTGKTLSAKEVQIKGGNNELPLESNNLPAGIYFLSFTNGKSAITKRFTVLN